MPKYKMNNKLLIRINQYVGVASFLGVIYFLGSSISVLLSKDIPMNVKGVILTPLWLACFLCALVCLFTIKVDSKQNPE